MAKDRELIQLARTEKNADTIAYRLNSSRAHILKVAKRLGLKLSPQAPRPDGRFKAKGE